MLKGWVEISPGVYTRKLTADEVDALGQPLFEMIKSAMKNAIVTYGEGNSVGKEMLRRRLDRIWCCACCRITYEFDGDESGKCPDCRTDPTARSAYTS